MPIKLLLSSSPARYAPAGSKTLDDIFLPIQLACKRKTSQSVPKMKFPAEFSLSANNKYFSNTKESIRFLEDIIVLYIDTARIEMGDPNQAGLLFWDVFRGRKTEPVLDVLKEKNIITEYIPNNMTNY